MFKNIQTADEITAEANAKRIENENRAVQDEIDKLTKETIVDILDWIGKQPNAPQVLKDKALQAVNARSKLK